MPAAPPPYEKIVLGFGAAIAVAAYLYWTATGHAQGAGWTSVAASRSFVVLGGAAVLALVLRLAVFVNRS